MFPSFLKLNTRIGNLVCLHKSIADVTTTHLSFPGGEHAHIFVSWLHPFKEQKLIVVGDRGMAVFNDGEIFGSGPFVGTATNLDSGKTIRLNLGGSFSVVEHSDGSTTVTSNGFVISSLFGTIFSGHGVIELDASGQVTSRTFNGREEDLCAELAGQ